MRRHEFSTIRRCSIQVLCHRIVVVVWLFAGGALSSAHAAIVPEDACLNSGKTAIVMTSPAGDRLVFLLERDGDAMHGMATLWKRNGIVEGRGPVTGRFGGTPTDDGRRGFELTIHWQPPLEGEVSAYGFLDRGFGRGNVSGFTADSVEVLIRTGEQCAKWPQEYYLNAEGRPGALPAPANTCVTGFVWREAHPWDRVCVTPESHDLTAADNREAPKHLERNDADGPVCKLPYFRRDAYRGDPVCAQLMSHVAAVRDNQLASHRTINESDAVTNPETSQYCAAYADEAVGDFGKGRTLGCDVTEEKWNSEKQAHVDWCMSMMDTRGVPAARQQAQAASDARKNALLKCELKAKPGSNPAYSEAVMQGTQRPPSKTGSAAVSESASSAAAQASAPGSTSASPGAFDTNFGVLTLTSSGGVYQLSNGRIRFVSKSGDSVEGVWEQDTSARQCADGRYYGPFRFRFTATGFVGTYGYCDGAPDAGEWNGTRR